MESKYQETNVVHGQLQFQTNWTPTLPFSTPFIEQFLFLLPTASYRGIEPY